MKKIIRLLLCLVLLASMVSAYNLYRDRQSLKENLIRLHVVANSDSAQDQQIKLQVKDAVVAYLQPIVEQFPTKDEAMEYIRQNLSTLRDLSNQVLEKLGIQETVQVTLEPEAFAVREYDTFSLPSGVYDALRIEIGEGNGKNWWCVVFPSLCVPACSEDFETQAVSSGFSQSLTNTLTQHGGYRMRFFLLDCVGKLENFFAFG